MGVPFKRILYSSFVVSIGGFLFGFDASVISGVIPFIAPQFNLSEVDVGWLVSSPTLSAMFSMLFAGRLSDNLGRRNALYLIAILYLISALLSTIAPEPGWLVLARMLGGVAFGGALIIPPLYIAEISPAQYRGRLVSVQQLNIVLGFSAAYFSNWALLKLQNADWFSSLFNAEIHLVLWRGMFAVEMLPALLYLLLLFSIPESPRWLEFKGFQKRAEEAVSKLGLPLDEFEMGSKILEYDSETRPKNLRRSNPRRDTGLSAESRLKMLLSPRYRSIFLIAILLGVMQQITGVNVIFFYAPMIFERTGLGMDASFAQAVVIGVINVVFTILALLLIDRIGRKPLLQAGLGGIIVSLFISAGSFWNASYELDAASLERYSIPIESAEELVTTRFRLESEFRKELRAALNSAGRPELESELFRQAIQVNHTMILIGILGFVASFAFSLGPVMWVMLSELFPPSLRGIAVSLVGFLNSLTSWVVQFLFPLELLHLGNSLTYALYGLFGWIGWLLFHRYLPETKGKTLEEIQNTMARGRKR